MSTEVFTTLAAVALGWALNEFSQRLRAGGAKRAAAGRALAELLEIRHHLKAIETVFTIIRDRFNVAPGEVLSGMHWIDAFLPGDPDLPRRYNEAVTEIAASYPILAFRLRSKERIPQLLVKYRALQLAAAAGRNPEPLMTETEALLRATGLEVIDEAILDLSWAHGTSTWWKIRRRLKEPIELPSEYSSLLERMGAASKESAASTPQGAA